MTNFVSNSTTYDKAKYINEIFAKIANKYDLLNNLMTLGLHKLWKKLTIKLALKECYNPTNALDLCCGTCDLAIILNELSPNTKITCIDNCSLMIDSALNKIQKYKLQNINVLLLDSENIPFQKSSFDLATVGFGLRNLINKEAFLEKVYDLLNKNGVFACIDLGHIKNSIFRNIFNLYFFKVVPKLGEIFAKNKEAYTYLPNSLLSYYNQQELKNLILSKGFRKCFYKNILGGAVAIHIATK